MGTFADSEGNYIVLYTEQTKIEDKYGAVIYLVKISRNGNKEEELKYAGYFNVTSSDS